MSDKKQSSVEWLFEKLLNTPQNKFDWYSLLQQAKAMHRIEIETAWYDGISGGECGSREQYYNETFGGQDNG